MAVDMFLKIEGIDGVSSDQSIEISSFSWGVSNTGAASSGGGGGAGKVVFQDLSVTKRVDKSSPLLYLTCCQGQHIPKATLTMRSSSQDPVGTPPSPSPSFEYKLTDCIISSARPGGSSGGDEVPTESVSFNFAKIEWTYSSADGRTVVRAGWDLKKNTKV